jgi:hypothetical protein
MYIMYIRKTFFLLMFKFESLNIKSVNFKVED